MLSNCNTILKKRRPDLLIVKPLYVPLKLLADQALLDHLPRDIPERAQVADELARTQAGWRGEQQLAYRLSSFQDDQAVRIFYGLCLGAAHNTFQIDTLVLTRQAAAILEVKNYSGILTFHSDGQMIRTLSSRRDGCPNPILQAQRQAALLTRWLSIRSFPQFPIEIRVAIANNTTIVENPDHLQSVTSSVIHTEQIPTLLSRLIQEHSKKLPEKTLSELEKQLLAAHTDTVHDVFPRFRLDPQIVRRGVRCPHCLDYTMARIPGAWRCTQCGAMNKQAHVPMILDYFLLFGPTMTNKQCRWFLNMDDRQLIRYLLKKMNFKPIGNGCGRGLYYERPTHKMYHDYYLQTKKEMHSNSSKTPPF